MACVEHVCVRCGDVTSKVVAAMATWTRNHPQLHVFGTIKINSLWLKCEDSEKWSGVGLSGYELLSFVPTDETHMDGGLGISEEKKDGINWDIFIRVRWLCDVAIWWLYYYYSKRRVDGIAESKFRPGSDLNCTVLNGSLKERQRGRLQRQPKFKTKKQSIFGCPRRTWILNANP